ncbi:MAG TPA: cell division protein FtsL [Candidatus Acidoferrales bacterium]|nr:cell division protein FtsL [Candidatus Acidoferrales bacterium]
MTEFYTSKRIDNSRLSRPAASRWREYAKRMAWAAAFAACGLLYTWQHFQDIQLRYQLENLQARQTQAIELNQRLHLETATLTSPMRIDAIARQKLGMTVSVPAQYLPTTDVPRDAYLAQRVPTQSAAQSAQP